MSYGIGDVPGSGYGAAVHLKDAVSYRNEKLVSEVSEETSNYRELR